MTRKVLIIEDDAALRNSIVQTLELEDLEPIPTGSFVQARRSIRSNFNGVILSDIRMPDQDGFDVLKFAQGLDPDLPVILITGHSDVPTAMKAMRQGAYDYLEKPFETAMLVETLIRALQHRTLVLGNRTMARQLDRSDIAAQNFPGKGPASQTLRHALRTAAQTSDPVHLYGEDGSGKRTAAFAIHALGDDDREYQAINCDTASPQILQNMDLDHPVTLTFKNTHLASTHLLGNLPDFLAKAADVRLITTSIAQEPGFAFPPGWPEPTSIRVPSILDRQEDIHDIFDACLRQTARASGRDMPMLSADIAQFLYDRDPPSNFYQLRQLVAEALSDQSLPPNANLTDRLEHYEKSVISDTLLSCDGRVADAAKALGVPRNTLYDRMAKLNVVAKDFRKK